MKHPLLTGAFLLCTSMMLCSQSWSWVHRSGGTLADEAERVVVDHDNNIVIAGKLTGTITIGTSILSSAGEKDILVAKYSPGGAVLWAVSCGGLTTDEGLSVAVDDSNNVLVTGYYQTAALFGTQMLLGVAGDEMFVAKFDPQGNLKWLNQANGPGNARARASPAIIRAMYM